ncbi:outer membrane beta-barrel protein [Thauera sp. JM12B12]|uniref:outer membrane beta-barrel protein n=1 Tax=Thauera sp. JM12B12 TaxID=3142262 RepID=UPI0031F3AABF
MDSRLNSLALSLLVAFGGVEVAQAQAPLGVDRTAPPRIRAGDQAEFPGLDWAGFRLFPELVFSTTRDDNIYARRRGEVEDTVFTLSPSLVLRSDWKAHEFTLDMGADIDRYAGRSAENVADFWIGAEGKLELGETLELFGGIQHTRDHEDRFAGGALSPQEQRRPTRYDHDEAHIGIATALGPFQLRAGATFDRFDYLDAQSTSGGTINNDDRRYDQTSVGARLAYPLSPAYALFVQYASDRRRYDETIDGAAFNRDSDGYRVAAGVQFARPAERLAGEVFAGRMKQSFDHAGFGDIDKPYFGALLSWRPMPQVKITAFVDRTLEETTVAEDGRFSSASVDTSYGVEIERELSNRLSVFADVSTTRTDYQDFARRDRVIDAGAGLRYYLVPTVFVGADLRVIDRNANVLDAQYSRSQLTLSLGYTPGRSDRYAGRGVAVSEAPWTASVPAASRFAGPYVGVGVGHGLLVTEAAGPRPGGGSDFSPFAGAGAGQNLFAGYGLLFGRWYLGFEAGLEASQADWSFSNEREGARTASVSQGRGGGLSLRGGHLLDGGALLYARLGRVRTRFDTYYTVNAYPEGAFDQMVTRSGTRGGVGADIPAGERVFVRIEYAYTDYDDYAVPNLNDEGATAERFDSRDGRFNLALGWRFGEGAAALRAVRRAAVRGAYAGAQVGHGGIDSSLTGSLSGDAGALTDAYSGAFGALGGTYGFFTGYGVDLGRWYAGIEIEIDESRIGWQHLRETRGSGGRDFSVDKKGDYGLALRLGYTLGDGALLYARAGAVRGRFDTTWVRGSNLANHVDRSDTLSGVRVGLGAEIPLGREAFVRLDYTRTRYADYGFVTTHAAPDQIRFENRESLFRLGWGVRF